MGAPVLLMLCPLVLLRCLRTRGSLRVLDKAWQADRLDIYICTCVHTYACMPFLCASRQHASALRRQDYRPRFASRV